MVNDRLPRLIFASSEESADMLYATKFSVPDAFLFLLQNGKKTILLSDLEIDRGRKQAKVDELIAFSSIEQTADRKDDCPFFAETPHPAGGSSLRFSHRLSDRTSKGRGGGRSD
jgi:hypothetical protein